MNALISYQFDEEPVRVVMIAGDPWFVANDVCRVLGLVNGRKAVGDLDDDEKGVTISDTLGGRQEMNVVSESGMYTLVFKSRKPEARRFRKWVTSEVLPSLRRTGVYQLHDAEPPPQLPSDLDPPRLTAGVAVVREARRLFGPAAARALWSQVGLPAVIAEASGDHSGDPFAEPLKDWLTDKAEVTAAEAARGIGIGDPDFGTVHRLAALLRLFGWTPRKVKRGHATANVWQRPQPLREG